MTATDTDPLAVIKACLADPAQDWRLCGYDIEWLVAEVDRLRGTPPTGGHTMRVTLDHDKITLTPVCHEAPGATCRATCSKGCDEWGADHEHALVPVDYCNAVEYLTADGWAEDCCDPKTEIPLHDGMPIDVEWDGGGYIWSPVKTPVAVTT